MTNSVKKHKKYGETSLITNWHVKQFIFGWELTDKQKEDFDYLSDEQLDSSLFVEHRGNIYCTDQFVRINGDTELTKDWNYSNTNSAFSAIVLKSLTPDNYRIGILIW